MRRRRNLLLRTSFDEIASVWADLCHSTVYVPPLSLVVLSCPQPYSRKVVLLFSSTAGDETTRPLQLTLRPAACASVTYPDYGCARTQTTAAGKVGPAMAVPIGLVPPAMCYGIWKAISKLAHTSIANSSLQSL